MGLYKVIWHSNLIILRFSINRVSSKNSHRRERLWISKLEDKFSLTFISLRIYKGENFDWKWIKYKIIKISSKAFSTSQEFIRVSIWASLQGITGLNLCHKVTVPCLPDQLTFPTFLWGLDQWDSCFSITTDCIWEPTLPKAKWD